MITDYDSLKSTVATWLNRTDLEADIPTFIQMAEENFRTDKRCRKLQDRGEFLITADGQALPSDFQSLESWYHDGPTYFGPIDITSANGLGTLKGRYGASGPPRAAAIIDGTVRYAPEPDDSYATVMMYWRKIVPLSDVATTNWLLDDHANIYLYGTLVETAPFLKEDSRIALWQTQLDRRLDLLDEYTRNQQFSGNLRRHFRPIG